MTLSSGTQFGSYQVSGPLGAGGMGEVYRATDTKLKREVALKVLPADFSTDAERLARFQREAELLAALNHPGIAQIYGLEQANGVTALVMELIDGPTLAERIEQGPLTSDDALNIALQIADALEAAHERGIVHRDLKPANIKLKLDGRVKVLDFGIAKAVDPALHSSGPVSAQLTTPAMTQSGMILGTAAYMSPEQARGKTVDRRTDIWAFGCVLYEMLTGQGAFLAEDVPLTLARVLSQPVDLRQLPNATTPALRHTIELCLEKDPKKRIADISDVRLALKGSIGKGLPALVTKQALPRRMLPYVAALAIGAAITVAAGQFTPEPAPVPQALNRFAHVIPSEQILRNTSQAVMALSPDGRYVVYNTLQGLYLRTLGELEARLISGTEEESSNVFFSPDSKSVAYASNGQLKRVAISGGAPVVIVPDLGSLSGASWGPGDVILLAQSDGISRVSANGGTPELLIPIEPLGQFGRPELLPDGDTVLFSTHTGGTSWDQAEVVAQSLASGERKVLIQGGSDAHYLPSGHLVYAISDGLFANVFNLATLTITGTAVPLAQGLMRATRGDAANFGIAADGTLAYVSSDSGGELRNLVWMTRDGSEELINAPPRNYLYVRLSPDQTRIALDVRDEENDIWIFDLARESLQRLTFDPGMNRSPVWSPDGMRVASTRQLGASDDIYWQAADGSGITEPLTSNSAQLGASLFATDFLPDGSGFIFNANTRDIWIATLDGNSKPLLDSDASEYNAALSPDGHWLAYQSNESGKFEVYVRPFPDVAAGRWQVSTNGGTQPNWNPDGSELFYLDLGRGELEARALMAVPVAAEPGFSPGIPEQLFVGHFIVALNNQREVYDVAADGQRFLMIRDAVNDGVEAAKTEIVIVQNFLDELQRLAPTP